MPNPKYDYGSQLNVAIKPELKKKLDLLAAYQGINKKYIVEKALKEFIEKSGVDFND